MDLSRFSIDGRLQENADIVNTYSSVFYEKLLAGLFEQDENLLVKTDIEKDRARVFMFPVFYWLTRPNKVGGNFRALYIVDNEEKLDAAMKAAKALANGFEDSISIVPLVAPSSAEPASGEQTARNGQSVSDAEHANLVLASMTTLIELADSGLIAGIAPRHFGFVVVDGVEKIAELPDEKLRAVQGHLLPSWERKTLVVEGKSTPRGKALAWDIADNPKEIRLQESIGLVGTVKTLSYEIKAEEKLRFVLGLASDPAIRSICLFCNLKSSAFEITKRLELNGVPTDYIAGALQPSRKKQILEKALSGGTTQRGDGAAQPGVDGAQSNADTNQPPVDTADAGSSVHKAFVLVLTDDGAKDLERARFPVVVNFDIPLEPELYADRLTFLDQQNPDARLYNLACERYMYGIPAIKRSIDPSLTLLPFEGVETLPPDASEGVVIERALPRQRDFREREPREREPRENEHRATEHRGEHRGGRREGPQRSDERERRQTGHHGERPQGGKARPNKLNKSDRTTEGRAPKSPSPGTADLYSMTMEERMELYRKKYGRSFQHEAPKPETQKPETQKTETQKTEAQNPAEQNSSERNSGEQETEKGHSFLDRLHGLWGNQKQ